MNNRHQWQWKKSKSREPFWSYQINSTAADRANLTQFWSKLAGLVVLFSWYVAPKRLPWFSFFNCPGCRIFILCEIHCYLSAHIFGVYYFKLSQCEATDNIFWNYPTFTQTVKMVSCVILTSLILRNITENTTITISDFFTFFCRKVL